MRYLKSAVLGTLLSALALAATGTYAGAAPAHRTAASTSTSLHQAAVVRLRMLQSPGGDFTVGVPGGDWRIQTAPISAAMPFATKISIDRSDGTEAFAYLLLPVNDLASNIAVQQLPCLAQRGSIFFDGAECALQVAMTMAKIGSYRWTGTATAQLLARVVAESGGRVSDFSARSLSRESAAFAISYADAQDGAVDELAEVTNHSFVDGPVSQWAGQPEFWNYAFVTGCKAPAGRLDAAARSACAAVLASFRPRPGWLAAAANGAVSFELAQLERAGQALTAAVQARGQASAMVSQWSAQTSELGLQRDMGMIEYTYRANLGTIQALGATQSILRDPATGETMTSQDDYSVYCEMSDGKVFGTNDLQAPAKPECYQQLQKIDPVP